MKRDRNYRIHQKNVKVRKKKRILTDVFLWNEDELNEKVVGRLDKGKVHCSCAMCSTKRAVYGPKLNELNKWSEMKKEIDEYDE